MRFSKIFIFITGLAKFAFYRSALTYLILVLIEISSLDLFLTKFASINDLGTIFKQMSLYLADRVLFVTILA